MVDRGRHGQNLMLAIIDMASDHTVQHSLLCIGLSSCRPARPPSGVNVVADWCIIKHNSTTPQTTACKMTTRLTTGSTKTEY